MSIRDLFRKHKIPTATDILTDLLCLRIAAYPITKISVIRGRNHDWLLTFNHNGRTTKLETSIHCDSNRPHIVYNATYIELSSSVKDGKYKWEEIKLSQEQKMKLSIPLASLWRTWKASTKLEEEHSNETRAVDVIESLIGTSENEVIDPVKPDEYNNPFAIDYSARAINEHRRLEHDDFE